MPAHQDPDPASASLTERLERCYTGVVHDIMRAMGLRDFTLPPELRPLMPERALAGPAFTIRGKVEKGADAHQTLLAWTGLLSQAPAWTGIRFGDSSPNRSAPACARSEGRCGLRCDGQTQVAAISYRVPLPCPVRSSKPASTISVSSRYAVARDTPAIATYFSVLMPPL